MKRICLVCMGVMVVLSSTPGQTPRWDWVKAIHTPEDERAVAVASDPSTGDVYIAGNWMGSLDGIVPVGTTESTEFANTFGGMDGMVVKMNHLGRIIWAFKAGGPGKDRIDDIHVDHEGNFYITGWIGAGEANLSGTEPLSSDSVIIATDPGMWYLAKYDPLGRLLWTTRSTNNDLVQGMDIATNQSMVLVTGHHLGIVQFGPLAPYPSTGGYDIFVAAFTPDGAYEWHVGAGSDGDDFANALTCDETFLAVAGTVSGTAVVITEPGGGIIPGPVNSAAGQADAFLTGFTIDGMPQGTLMIASSSDDDCQGVAMDDDHFYLVGTIGQEALFPGYTGNPVGYRGGMDAFVCAIGRNDRQTRWVRTLTGDPDGDQVPEDISLSPDGTIVVAGSYTQNLQSTDILRDNKGLEDIFVASYNTVGDEIWVRTGGGAGIDKGNGVCASTKGVVYLAGEYGDFATFESRLLPGDGFQNFFAGKLLTDCVDAVGGVLSSPDIVVPEGEAVTLVLRNYLGDIRWQFSVPDENNWTLLTADLSDSITHFPGGTADYRAFLTSGFCAPDSSNVIRIEVVNTNIRFAYAGEDVKICRGDSVQLKASGGDFYKWEPPDSLSMPDIPDPWARPFVTTDYVVHVTNQDGLTDSDTVTVTVLPRPKVYAGEDIQACQGEQVRLTAEGEGSIFWNPRNLFIDPTLPDPVVSLDTTTTFRVVITDTSGCLGADRVTVFITDPPLPRAGRDQQMTATFETMMEASLEPGESGTWRVDSGNGVFEDIHRPDTRVSELEMGINLFTWIVSNGICPEAEDQVEILVEESLIPTVITPNGDGKTDYFFIRGIEGFGESELSVINRWGEVIFSASPYLNNWDGSDQEGNELPEDTYYIVLKFTADDIRKSFVVIIR